MLNVQECVLVYQDLILTLVYVDMLLISVMSHPIVLYLLHGEPGSDRHEKGPNMQGLASFTEEQTVREGETFEIYSNNVFTLLSLSGKSLKSALNCRISQCSLEWAGRDLCKQICRKGIKSFHILWLMEDTENTIKFQVCMAIFSSNTTNPMNLLPCCVENC